MKRSEFPKFGPLQNVKTIVIGSSVAGPFGGSMMADFGADVTLIESAKAPDINRADTRSIWDKERRNVRNIVMNFLSPEGKEILGKMLATTDILIMVSKGPQYEKYGITDEWLWSFNPKLVISHVTGFGMTGDPDFIGRPSYDAIGQAFSGYVMANGEPNGLPAAASPYTADYVTAMLSSWACLAAYIRAQETGVGESIDCAQYEAMVYILSGFVGDWLNYKVDKGRQGSGHTVISGWGVYECSNGYVYVALMGPEACKKFLPLLGFEWGSPDFPISACVLYGFSPGAKKFNDTMIKYCKEHTKEEVEKTFNEYGCATSQILTVEMMENHPHYLARDSFITYPNSKDGKPFKTSNIIPKFKNNPGRFVAPAPFFGRDNEDILQELGYTEEEIKGLYEKEIIAQKEGF